MAFAALAAAARGVGKRAKAPFKAAAAAWVVGNAARARPLCMATPRKAAAAQIYDALSRATTTKKHTPATMQFYQTRGL